MMMGTCPRQRDAGREERKIRHIVRRKTGRAA
jgi:hypothetical protein